MQLPIASPSGFWCVTMDIFLASSMYASSACMLLLLMSCIVPVVVFPSQNYKIILHFINHFPNFVRRFVKKNKNTKNNGFNY